MFDINDAIFFSNNVSNVNFDGLNNTQSTNSFLDNITTGGLLSGLNDIGLNPNDLNSSDIIDVGLNTLTSLIPGFSIVNNLVGGDIGQNISNVISYGLNSWGATTSPENIGQYLNAFQDDINQLVNNFDKDPNTYFNELGKFLWWGTQFYGRMRRDHANANSTKEAYDMAINFFDKNQKEIWWKIYNALESKGFATKKKVSVIANSYPHLGQPVNQNDPPIDYWHVTIDTQKMVKSMSIENNQDNINPDGTSSNIPNGQTLQGGKSSNSWLWILGLFFLIKK